jgi:outer membrane protein assembly factor BamD (BamD/ComL family)
MLVASQKIRVFKKYQNLTSLINSTSDQLFYVENPEEFTKDSITFIQDSSLYVQDSLRVLEELNLFTEHLEGLAGFVDTLTNKDTALVKDSIAVDSLNDSTAVLDTSLINQNQRAEELLGVRDRNLDRRNVKEGINIDSLFAERWDPERKFPTKPVKPDLSEDSLKSILVKNQIELGNLFLTEMEMYDSAYYYYNYVLTYYPNTIHQANALYALGSYYLSVEERTKADSLFNFIYDNYKTENIVNAAADKLNKPLINLEYDPAKDLYTEAENEMIKKDFNTSLDKFYRIYREYPRSTVAPKALYASGWILENELNMNDSAAIVYDTLSTLYPQSEFTVKIRPKLTEYKQYQKAVEDSIKKIELEKLQLLANDSLSVSDSLQIDKKMEEAFYPKDEEKIEEVKLPDTKFPSDTTRSVILNDPRRNPRRK